MTIVPPRDITIVRVVDAPQDLVFAVWTDIAHLTNWWGPRGFTTTTTEFDLRPGGTWRFVMHGPDGTDYPNLVVFREVVRPERLRYDHRTGDGGAEFEVTVTFAALAGKTRVTLVLVFPTVEARNAMVEFGAVEGGEQTLVRFVEELKRRQGGG